MDTVGDLSNKKYILSLSGGHTFELGLVAPKQNFGCVVLLSKLYLIQNYIRMHSLGKCGLSMWQINSPM